MINRASAIDLIPMLRELCRLLSQDPLTIDDVRSFLNELPITTTVEPEPASDVPAHVRLVLPEPEQPSLDSLENAFGSFKRLPRMHRLGVDKHIVYIDLEGYPHTCALIAETERDLLLVQAITIRRDIRLD